MNKKTVIFIAFVLCAFCSFSQSTESAQDQFVTFRPFKARVDTNLFLSYYWHDALRGHPIYLKTTGMVAEIYQPTFIIEASGRQIPYLVYPGEKINVIDTARFLNFFIEGNDSRTNELQFFQYLVNKTGNIYNTAFDPPPTYTRKVNNIQSLNKNMEVIHHLLLTRLTILDSAKAKGHISDSFTQLANVVIRTKAFLDTLNLAFRNKDFLSAFGGYAKLIKEKTSTFKEILFIRYQFYYRCFTALVGSCMNANPNWQISNINEFEEAFKFIRDNFSGPARDFGLMTCMSKAIANTIPIKATYIQKFNEECLNEEYKFIIHVLLAKQKTGEELKSNDMILSGKNNESQKIQDLMSKFKGSVVVLDFWASWCGPCRAEMPYSIKLSEKYRNEVVFVYISVDEYENEWKQACAALGLNETYNYRFENINSTFLKDYKIMGVPRYMILNKVGKIIDDDAPPPSHAKLSEILNRLIKE